MPVTDPIKKDQDLTELQREADRQKSEWPEVEESASDSGDSLASGDGSPQA